IEIDLRAFTVSWRDLKCRTGNARLKNRSWCYLATVTHSHSHTVPAACPIAAHVTQGSSGRLELPCGKARIAFAPANGRRRYLQGFIPKGFIPRRPPASTVPPTRRCCFPPRYPWSGSQGAAR